MIDCNVVGKQCDSCTVKHSCTDYHNFNLGYNQALENFKQSIQEEYQKENIDYTEMCVLEKIIQKLSKKIIN